MKKTTTVSATGSTLSCSPQVELPRRIYVWLYSTFLAYRMLHSREKQALTLATSTVSPPAVPPSLLQMVQAQIDATTAWPLTGTAVNPDLIGISFSTTVTFVAGATAAEQQAALAKAVSGPGPSPLRTYNSHARGRGTHQQLSTTADGRCRLLVTSRVSSGPTKPRLFLPTRDDQPRSYPPGAHTSVLHPLLP